ncbi:rCG28544 [Rattus norvegicus]|uniref:RCG28544 n=1 Tax=Rattus norvegicus TaxID=10116 RepID=A6HVY4_RAT|nr:rCG28544 [Rattus norvegicus]
MDAGGNLEPSLERSGAQLPPPRGRREVVTHARCKRGSEWKIKSQLFPVLQNFTSENLIPNVLK